MAAVPRMVWDPAGSDRQLSQACVELRAGRTGLALEVMAACRHDYPLRAHRSLVLGAAAASRGEAERVLVEAPEDPDARLLYARTAMVRALRVYEAKEPAAAQLAAIARRACHDAAGSDEQDPTPWAGLLALARLGHGNLTGPKWAPEPGPWDLMEQVWKRDRWHREAHHRLLACFFTRHGGSSELVLDLALRIAHEVPPDSDLQVLRLVALVERFREMSAAPGTQADTTEMAEAHWLHPFARSITRDVYEDWFSPWSRSGSRELVPVADLALLAHSLWMGGDLFEAGQVLVEMRPYACVEPWSLHGEPAAVLARAYEECWVTPTRDG